MACTKDARSNRPGATLACVVRASANCVDWQNVEHARVVQVDAILCEELRLAEVREDDVHLVCNLRSRNRALVNAGVLLESDGLSQCTDAKRIRSRVQTFALNLRVGTYLPFTRKRAWSAAITAFDLSV